MDNASKIKCFRDLEIWKKGIVLVESIYKITQRFPKDEIYGLSGQLRRAAISVPSNIAEGFARFHNKEYKHFLYIALGSCAEMITQIVISAKLGYINNAEEELLIQNIEQISKMTMSLIKKLNTSDQIPATKK